MHKVSVTFVYCDDYRAELFGKCTLVGLYRGFISIRQEMPFLPKFVCVMLITCPRSLCGQPVKLRFKVDGQTQHEMEQVLPASDPPPEAEAAGLASVDYPTIPFELVNFSFPHGRRLSFEIDINGTTFSSEPLMMLRLPSLTPGT